MDAFINSLEPITFEDFVYIGDKLRNEIMQEDTLHEIAKKLGFEEGLKDECFNGINSWEISFMMIMEWKRRIKQSSSKGNSKDGASKRVLARLIMEIANSIEDVNQKEILKTIARKLDMHITALHHG